MREELERALRSEEETRQENARVKAELALVEGKVASAENEASLAKAKELAKEKECQMLADVVRDLSALGSRNRASDSDSSESDESGEEDDVYEDEDEESAGPKIASDVTKNAKYKSVRFPFLFLTFFRGKCAYSPAPSFSPSSILTNLSRATFDDALLPRVVVF